MVDGVYTKGVESKLNIYQYIDYRELLSALIAQRKKDKKIFSYRWFSQKAGLTAPNFLNLVVKRKRHLSSDTIEKVIEVFQLKGQEAEFFRFLALFNKAKTLSEREHFAHQMTKLKKFQNEYPLSQDQFEYYSKWYHIPIREMLSLKFPPKTEEEISDTIVPYISKAVVSNALEKLKSLNLITENGQSWKVAQESVATGNKFSSYGVVQYHKQMMGLAVESLDRFSASDREVSSVSVGLSEAKFEKVKKMIEEIRSQIMTLSEEDDLKERIYQINFQVFPLSKRRGSK